MNQLNESISMSVSYQKFAGICGILAGIAGLLYLIFFLLLKNPAALLPSLSLLASGLLASFVLVGLYLLVRRVDEGFALAGLLLGIIGTIGAATHAAFDLSNNLHPPTAPFIYPNPIDPRGFLTFAVSGLAIFVLSWLLGRVRDFSRSAGYLGEGVGALLILLYLAYLISLNASNPIVLLLVLLTGVLQPVWYLWIGWIFWQRKSPSSQMGIP